MTDEMLADIEYRSRFYERDVVALMYEVKRLQAIVSKVESKDFMIVATSTIERMQEELCRLKRGCVCRWCEKCRVVHTCAECECGK